MNLFVLPDEIFLAIFNHLDIPDLARVALVCRRFLGLARDGSLWRPRAVALYAGASDTQMSSNMYWGLYRVIAEIRKKPVGRYDSVVEIKIIKYLIEHIRCILEE